jgi:hypothetical protein
MDYNAQTFARISEPRQMIVQTERLSFVSPHCFIEPEAEKKTVIEYRDFSFLTGYKFAV